MQFFSTFSALCIRVSMNNKLVGFVLTGALVLLRLITVQITLFVEAMNGRLAFVLNMSIVDHHVVDFIHSYSARIIATSVDELRDQFTRNVCVCVNVRIYVKV